MCILGMTLVVFLVGCTTPTPIVIVVTATSPSMPGTEVPTTSVPVSVPSLTSRPSLPIPSPTVGPSPTPVPVVATITTKNGFTVQLSQFAFNQSCGQDIGYTLNGLPTTSGINVSWNYIESVDIGSPDEKGGIPTVITLLNSETLKTELKWGFLNIMGKSDLGDFETALNQVDSMLLQRNEPVQVPTNPPTSAEGPSTTITWDETSIEVSGFRFFYFYCNTMWIPAKTTREEMKAVPLNNGLMIDLDKVKEIQFGDVRDSNITVSVVTVDGRTINDEIRTDWRLRGYANIGEFDFSISKNPPKTITIHSP